MHLTQFALLTRFVLAIQYRVMRGLSQHVLAGEIAFDYL